jgi:hypothetical protein
MVTLDEIYRARARQLATQATAIDARWKRHWSFNGGYGKERYLTFMTHVIWRSSRCDIFTTTPGVAIDLLTGTQIARSTTTDPEIEALLDRLLAEEC